MFHYLFSLKGIGFLALSCPEKPDYGVKRANYWPEIFSFLFQEVFFGTFSWRKFSFKGLPKNWAGELYLGGRPLKNFFLGALFKKRLFGDFNGALKLRGGVKYWGEVYF